MNSSLRMLNATVLVTVIAVGATACSPSDSTSPSSAHTTARTSTIKAASTPSESPAPTGVDALRVTPDGAVPDPAMDDDPVFLQDGSGSKELTGLDPKARYVFRMACSGGGSFRVTNQKGTTKFGVVEGCVPGAFYSFDTAEQPKVITDQGRLKVVAPSTTHWTIGAWKHD